MERKWKISDCILYLTIMPDFSSKQIGSLRSYRSRFPYMNTKNKHMFDSQTGRTML